MILTVPQFAHLSDYSGIWAMEPEAFAALWDFAGRLDLAAHVKDAAEPLRAATEMAPGPGSRKIAVIKMSGVLMKSQSSLGGTSTVQLRREIRQAAADPEVAGILLNIDSPGGTVAGTDQLAREVRAADKQKPVWGHAEDLAASAAYWVGSQTDRLTAETPNTLVGGIGTYQVIHDHSAAAEKAGVRTLVMSTGPLKGMGAMGAKVTDEQAAHVQGLVNAAQESFDSAVQSGRKLTKAGLADVRHGGVMPAKTAVDKNLIDAVQPIGKTLAEFSAALKKDGGYQRALEALRAGECGIDLATGDLLMFTHNSETAPNEPDWGSVDKTALPRLAFADRGETDKKSTWSFPHHWVQNAGGKDENGVWTRGTLLLHRGGLNAAWSAAQGGRSGQKASRAVIDHLEAHRKALGLDTKSTADGALPMLARGLPMLRAG